VIGLYLAEGNIRADGRTVQFTLGAHEQGHAACVQKWAARVGFKTSAVDGPGTLTIYVFGKALAVFLGQNFGNGAHHKRLSNPFLLLPPAKQLKILEYYVRGDGHFDTDERSAITVTSRSRVLAQQVQLLLVRSGYAASICRTTDHEEPRYGVTIAGRYGEDLARYWGVTLPAKLRRYNHTHIEAAGALHPIRTIRRVGYAGEVINLEVATDHTYCVPFVVHNCWIEKEALAGVVEQICGPLDLPYLACRGYLSQSEMYVASKRMAQAVRAGKTALILHLGDHDPSGIDMTRDNEDRLQEFMGNVTVKRLALNYDQIAQYRPPPNPAKSTDARFHGYAEKFGTQSWELDALEPTVLRALIERAVNEVRDARKWAAAKQVEAHAQSLLRQVSTNWDSVTASFAGENG